MRLIDADALYKKIEELQKDTKRYVDEEMDLSNGIGIGEILENERMLALLRERTQFMYDIADAPTIEAVPVRHGRWIFSSPAPDGSERYVCSECNCGYAREAYRYCPACGAKMR